MKAVVLGGTGLLGSLIAQALQADGHEVVATSRSTGVDVLTGEGLAEALTGANVVVDATNIETRSKSKAVKFFGTASRNIVEAVRAQQVPHLVTVSIYNATLQQAQKMGYYAGKAAQEQAVLESDVPHTIVRSTQWYELAETILQTAKFGPVVVTPPFLSRPAAAEAVAKEIAKVAAGEPRPDGVVIAGPEERDLADLVVAIAERQEIKAKFLRLSPPGMGAMKSGALLPPKDTQGIGPTFEEWLDKD